MIEGSGSIYIFTDGSVPITNEMAKIIQKSCPAGVAVTIAATSPYPFLWGEENFVEYSGSGFGEYMPESDHIGGIFSEIYTFIDV
jgi:hypothetical protein